jgi:streptomycin 3"-kinase
LPLALQRTPPTQILRQIEGELRSWAGRRAQLRLDVCHGELCLANTLVDPSTSQVQAFIDMDRLATADPYGDIALLLATARQTWSDEAMASRAHQQLCEIYGTELDKERPDSISVLIPSPASRSRTRASSRRRTAGEKAHRSERVAGAL